jgi:hypothetical protein
MYFTEAPDNHLTTQKQTFRQGWMRLQASLVIEWRAATGGGVAGAVLKLLMMGALYPERLCNGRPGPCDGTTQVSSW